MKKHKTAWMGLALVMAMALGLAWMACREIPNNEDKMTLEISVDLLGIDEASFRDSNLKQVVMPASEMEGSKLIEPPEEDKLHLKIKLTNPKEVFYVWNYNGKPVTITVASGTDRVIDVEGYLVYGYGGGGELVGPVASYPVNMFPADHMMTVNPVSERTLDLSGEATTVKVEVDYDPYTGYINGGTVEGLEVDGEVQPLPVDYECPPNTYMANLADRDWGLVFPSIALYMDTGGMYQVQYSGQQSVDPELVGPMSSFYIDNVPLNKNIGIHVWHYFAGFNKTLGVYTGSTVTKTDPFVFKGFQPDINVSFSPDTVDGVTTGYYQDVYIMANGGYGGYYMETNEDDTCEGNIYSFFGGEMSPQASMPGMSDMAVGVYEFAPYDDCTISIDVYDCGGDASASASMQVTINEVCGDGYCNGSETTSNCYEDCPEEY